MAAVGLVTGEEATRAAVATEVPKAVRRGVGAWVLVAAAAEKMAMEAAAAEAPATRAAAEVVERATVGVVAARAEAPVVVVLRVMEGA